MLLQYNLAKADHYKFPLHSVSHLKSSLQLTRPYIIWPFTTFPTPFSTTLLSNPALAVLADLLATSQTCQEQFGLWPDARSSLCWECNWGVRSSLTALSIQPFLLFSIPLPHLFFSTYSTIYCHLVLHYILIQLFVVSFCHQKASSVVREYIYLIYLWILRTDPGTLQMLDTHLLINSGMTTFLLGTLQTGHNNISFSVCSF